MNKKEQKQLSNLVALLNDTYEITPIEYKDRDNIAETALQKAKDAFIQKYGKETILSDTIMREAKSVIYKRFIIQTV